MVGDRTSNQKSPMQELREIVENQSADRRFMPLDLDLLRRVVTAHEPPAVPAVEPVARVINNNQPGWTNIVETAPNVTLDVGAPLYSRESVMRLAAALAGAIHRNSEPPAESHQADYAAALREIAKGPPGHFPNDEVAAWAGQIASDALSLPPRPSVTKSEPGWDANGSPVHETSVRLLARQQPCGCIVCTCDDDQRCRGCGAKHCGTHPVSELPNPRYADEV